jgi:nitroreductase
VVYRWCSLGFTIDFLGTEEVALQSKSELSLSAIDAVCGRRSIRRFLSDAVPESIVRDILNLASRAPSATNSQPWLVHVVTDTARDRLSKAVIAAARANEISPEYLATPDPWWEPFLTRRRKVGYDLYALYGIDRQDKAARKLAALRNFEFFGAPVGLFFTMERALLYGSWLDVGMYMQNVMTLARAFGLETCPQQAWCRYAAVVRRELEIDDRFLLISGMSLGYADRVARENTLTTEREPVDAFATFHSI